MQQKKYFENIKKYFENIKKVFDKMHIYRYNVVSEGKM